MKVTDAEWTMLEVLWEQNSMSLKELTQALQPINGWNKNANIPKVIASSSFLAA